MSSSAKRFSAEPKDLLLTLHLSLSLLLFVIHSAQTEGAPGPSHLGTWDITNLTVIVFSFHHQKQRDRAREGPVSSRNHACKSGAFREDVRHLNAESGRLGRAGIPGPLSEADRQAVNQWIRAARTL